MEVIGELFHNCANLNHEKVVDRNTVERNVRIVPAPFCTIYLIEDGCHLPINDHHNKERAEHVQNNSIEF